jgi:hypothetical protein
LPAAAPALAASAERAAPKRFVGAMYDREIQDAAQNVQRQQWAAMASSGVESARVIFSWELAQERRHGAIDFRRTDAMVEEAARHGIDPLPVVMYAPPWARLVPHPASAPSDHPAFAGYVRALVRRYGPSGSFWRTNPGVPARPVRAWQIWNEPHLEWQFMPHEGWAPRYGALLRTGYRAVKAADPGARVVLGGMVNDAWRSIDKLYRTGGVHGYFDVAAVHVYSADPNDFAVVVERVREALDRNGGAKRRIFVTEAGASASAGSLEAPHQQYFQVTQSQLASLVPATFKRLARIAEGHGVERVYWYTWASGYSTDMTIFGFSGLNAYVPGGRVYPLPGLDGFRKAARTLQGCKKDTKARCR